MACCFVESSCYYRAFAYDAPEAPADKKKKAAAGKATSSGPNARSREKKGLSYAERKELDGLLTEISALEGEKSALELFFSSPAPGAEEMERSRRRYAELSDLIEARTARWEILAANDLTPKE